ncbi:MAG: hypothetical protein LLG01_02890 [Planctomycetaceae bacterium]|nr:hypothetical protein [Planctomycetaceae bacterium]
MIDIVSDLLNVFAGMPGTESDIRPIDIAAPASRRETAGVRSGDEHLEDRLDRLTLICMAMWSLLSEKTTLTPADLAQRVKEIDLADGKEDGRLTRTIKTCHKCNRVMSPRHSKCLYCGSVDLSSDPFRAAM